MNRALPVVALVVVVTIASAFPTEQAPVASARPAAPQISAAGPVTVKPSVSHTATMTVAEQNSLGKTYCVGCHNDRNKDRTSGLSFQSFDAATITDHADVGERMIRRL